MPSIRLDLGRYVVLKPRADGTHRVLFQVPERLRPSGWSPTIPLPRTGERKGDLADAGEVARIQADAKALLEELKRARAGAPPPESARTLAKLISAWQLTDEYKATRPKTKKGYDVHVRNIQAWSLAAGHPDPTTITKEKVREFLTLFDDRPTSKKRLLEVLHLVLGQATELGWRPDNPAGGIRVKVPEAKIDLWDQADVDLYVEAAEAIGRASIALIILLEWEIGQRLTDVRAFRPGAEYDPKAGVFRFHQSKTDSWVTIPVSLKLRQLLAKVAEGQLFLFRDERTAKAYTESRLTHVFGDEVRVAAMAKGAPHRILRQLRHSCVVELARAEATVPEICSVTGHSLASAERILRKYLPRDNALAWSAQRKRKIIRSSGGDA